jgi:hypothetical protein
MWRKCTGRRMPDRNPQLISWTLAQADRDCRKAGATADNTFMRAALLLTLCGGFLRSSGFGSAPGQPRPAFDRAGVCQQRSGRGRRKVLWSKERLRRWKRHPERYQLFLLEGRSGGFRNREVCPACNRDRIDCGRQSFFLHAPSGRLHGSNPVDRFAGVVFVPWHRT